MRDLVVVGVVTVTRPEEVGTKHSQRGPFIGQRECHGFLDEIYTRVRKHRLGSPFVSECVGLVIPIDDNLDRVWLATKPLAEGDEVLLLAEVCVVPCVDEQVTRWHVQIVRVRVRDTHHTKTELLLGSGGHVIIRTLLLAFFFCHRMP
jgi:hypothetical protein